MSEKLDEEDEGCGENAF